MGEAQEAEDEARPRRYPRSRYRPDGTRRRTAGELRARGARNQWPPSTSQNKRGADNRPRGQQARDRTQSLQPRAQANQCKHRGPRQDEHRDYGWRNWDSRSRDGQSGGQEEWQWTWQHRGRDRSRDRQPTHWGGRSSRPHYFGRADSARDRQPSQGYRGAAHPATGRRTATPGIRSRQPSRSQHAAGTTKAARLTAEETTPRAEPRQGNEKATGAVPVVQVVDEPAGAPGSRTSAPSAPKTAPNRPALKSRAESATQAPQAMQRAGSKPPQPKHVCQKKWALLEDLQLVIHKANSKGATDLLYDYLGGGSFKQRRTDFHKLECCKGIPCVGNWTVAMFAHLLAGTTLNSTKQAKVYGDAVEGWISDIASEPEFEELTGHIAAGLTLSSLILEKIPRLMYEAMSWQITLPQLRDYIEEYYGPQEVVESDQGEPTPAPKPGAVALEPSGLRSSAPRAEQEASSASDSYYTEESEAEEGEPMVFTRPPCQLDFDRARTISKRLSVVLRHDTTSASVKLKTDGTVLVSQLLGLRILKSVRATEADIVSVCYWNKKQRFRLITRDGQIWVGATQGHSIEGVNVAETATVLDFESTPAYVLHATRYDFLKSIYENGLLPGGRSAKRRSHIHTVEQTPGYKDMFPDGSDVVLVIRTAKTTATWYKTSNGYYITADPIGQEAIQAVRLVESDEEIARSAKAPPPICAVLQALIRCSQQGSRPSAPAHRPPGVSTGSSSLTHKSSSAYMHRCLPSREEGPVDDCRQERAHTSCCPAGLVCRLMTFPITTAADSTGGHPGAVAAAPDSSRATTWQEPLVYPDRREAQTSLPFLCVILAVAVYTCGSVARARSCACLTSKARSTNNHAVYTPPDVSTEIKNTSRTGPKSGGLAAINIATLRPALDEVRVPPGPPTGGEPAYGIKPWSSQGGKVAGGATPRQTTKGPVRPTDYVHHETESCPLRSLCHGKSLRDPTRGRLARRHTFPSLSLTLLLLLCCVTQATAGGDLRPPGSKRALRRAAARAKKDGSTLYKGQRFTRDQLAHVPTGEATRRKSENRTTSAGTGARRGGQKHVQRFKVLSLNVGSLSTLMWQELREYLASPANPRDAIMLQETHWSTCSEFRTNGWTAIHSGTTARADGVMTLVHPKHPSARVRYEEVTPGRVLRVQVQMPTGRVELFNCYQHPHNFASNQETLKEKRQSLLNKLGRSIQGIPQRATLIVAGDFQAELTPQAPLIGRAVCRTPFHVGDAALDPHAFGRFVASHGLVALNTWYGKAQPTQFNTAPNRGAGTSQIDHILTRLATADACAKHVRVEVPPIGTWRAHVGHHSLSTSVRIMNHFLLPQRTRPRAPFCVAEVTEAVRMQGDKARELLTEIDNTICSRGEDEEINGLLMHACSRVFPLQVTQPRTPSGTIVHLWQLRAAARYTAVQRDPSRRILHAWRALATHRQAAVRAHKDCKDQKRRHILDLLAKAEGCAHRCDQRGLYQVVRQLAPWKPHTKILLKGEGGALLNHAQEHAALVEHSRQLFAPRQPPPDRTGVQLPLIFTVEEVEAQLRLTKSDAARHRPRRGLEIGCYSCGSAPATGPPDWSYRERGPPEQVDRCLDRVATQAGQSALTSDRFKAHRPNAS